MLTEVYDLHAEGSLSAKLRTYIQDDSKDLFLEKRPLMLICPGGGSLAGFSIWFAYLAKGEIYKLDMC